MYAAEIAPEATSTPELIIHTKSIELGLNESLVYKVIECEGGLSNSPVHKNIDETGKVWSEDYGPLQVNDFWHEADMKKAGLDIADDLESLSYGLDMMAEEGLAPWKASKYCWDK